MKRAILFLFALILSYGLWASISQYPAPNNLSTTNIDYNEATLRWSNNSNAYLWIVEYNISQNPYPNHSIVSNDSLRLNFLVSGMTYNWRVAMIDIYGDTTLWSEIMTFKTQQPISICQGISQLQIENMTSNGINVQWVGDSTTSQWEVVYGSLGSDPNIEGISAITSNYNYLIPNLSPGYWYQIAVRSVCQGYNSPWSFINTKFIPNQNYILPVQESFEDIAQMANFGFINGSINPWLISSSYNSTLEGENSLYVSTTSGITNQYYPNESAINYSYIDVFIPSYATSFYLDFKWKCKGEGVNDGLKVFLSDPNATLDINQLPPANQIGQTIYNGNDSVWNFEHIDIPAQFVGQVRRLVFAWVNNASLGGESSAIVDDIYITARYCATPTNLSVGYISYSSAELDWDFAYGQSLFNLQYKKIGQSDWTQINSVSPLHMLTNLDDNTDYLFRIQADCLTENSFWSEPDTFKTNLLCLPPQFITSNLISDTGAVINWDLGTNNSSWIFEYALDNTSNPNFTRKKLFNNTDTLSGLTPNSDYLVRIKSISLQGDTSQYSSLFKFKTLCTPINQYPYTDFSDSIYWNSDTNFYNIPQCWRIASDTNLLSPYFDFSLLSYPEISLDYSFIDTNLTLSKAYLLASMDGVNYFVISQINQSIVSSGNFKIEVPELAGLSWVRFSIAFTQLNNSWIKFGAKNFQIKDICKTPEDVSITDLTHNSVIFEWTGYPNNSSWEYVLTNLSNNDSTTQIINTHPLHIPGLLPNTNYRFKIRSLCGVGYNTPTWKIIDFKTNTVSTQCPIPVNFKGQYILNPENSEHSILLSWDNSTHNQWILEYKLRYAIQWQSEKIYGTNQYALRNLPLGQEYMLKLRTLCSDTDSSSWTDTKIVVVGQSSIEDIDILNTISIYPNPADKYIIIDNPSGHKLETIQLINNNGQVLKTWNEIPKQIEISSYPQGNYYINLKTQSKTKTFKLIISR